MPKKADIRIPTIEEIQATRSLLAPHLPMTPLAYAPYLSEQLGRRVWFKLETQQPTHSFKVRPAFANLLTHKTKAQQHGVITSSSGNFAQAVAYASQQLDIDAQIVMMSITAPVKIERTKQRGARVVICGPTYEDRWNTTYRLQEETGRLLVHPYDSIETISGSGVIALELLEQLERPFSVLIPTSGGGMLSGVARTLKALRPACHICGIQPKANGAMKRSLDAGERINVGTFHTIADALTASYSGERTFEIAKQYVDQMQVVEENAIAEAVRTLYHQHKLVVETGGSVGVAALQSSPGLLKDLPHQDIVCVLSGGNIAHSQLQSILSETNEQQSEETPRSE